MPKTHSPRKGSLQYWPRKRSKRAFARIRNMPQSAENKLLGFAGYKAGMTHLIIDDKRPHIRGNSETSYPVTVIECPPIKVSSIRFYKKNIYGLTLSHEIITKPDKELSRKLPVPKKITDKIKEIESNLDQYHDIRINVYTQPKFIGIGKKKPEIFELSIGGDIKQKLEFAKSHLGKEIPVKDVINEGQQLDIHAVTKGKGFQGTVKRFGVKIRQKKSEKTKRGAGNLGAWTPKRVSWRIPQSGKMGYHTRTEHNKLVLKVGDKPEEINPKGGFLRYGLVKNHYIIVKGSVSGAKKRLIRFNIARRPSKKLPSNALNIRYISLESKQ